MPSTKNVRETSELKSIDNVVIRASAGSGKTFQLCNRFVRLLLAGVHCQDILATTFTRKAAGEILDRVVGLLSSAACSSADAQRLCQELELPNFDQPNARRLLRHVLENMHRLQVGTLDSFFSRIARSFTFELGLHPEWTIAEEGEIYPIIVEAVDRVLAHQGTLQLLQLMDKGDVSRKVAQAIQETVEQLYSVYLDSAPEAWQRLPELKPLNAAELDALLTHLSQLPVDDRRMSTALDEHVLNARAEKWEDVASKGLISKLISNESKYYRVEIPTNLIAELRPLIEHVRAVLVQQIKSSNWATYQLLERFQVEFDRAKRRVGLMEFDDVTRVLGRLQSEMGNSKLLRRRLDLSVEHVLLDEFQDTSPQQWRVLQPLARYVTSPNAPQSFFCVGDMKQAIFGWRGGVAEVFELVQRDLPKIQPLELTNSHRSSPIIMDTVNRVFENLNQFESNNEHTNAVVAKWRSRFTRHTTEKKLLPGYSELLKVADDQDAMAATVERVTQLSRAIPTQTIAVLTQTNAEVAEIIFRLQAAGLRASEEGGTALRDSAAVNLLISLLQMADHPDDSASWFHVAHSPLRPALQIPEFEKRERFLPAPDSMHTFAARIRKDLVENGYANSLTEWSTVLLPHCTEREVRRLQKLIELGDEFDRRSPSLRASEFLRFVETTRVEDPTAARIRVMTIHKSKGLEFDAVVLPCLSQNLAGRGIEFVVARNSPTDPISLVCRRANSTVRPFLGTDVQAAHDQQRDRVLSESICTLYVAMTRARHALYMIVDKPDQEHHQRASGILLTTLANDRSRKSGVRYAHGDPKWFQMLAPPAVETRDSAGEPYYFAPQKQRPRIRLARAPVARRLSHQSPSGLEGTGTTTLGPLLRSGTNRAALQRGDILHDLFATVEWLDSTGNADPDRLAKVQARYAGSPGIRDLVREFQALLQTPVVQHLLNRELYVQTASRRVLDGQLMFEPLMVTVANERRFVSRDGDAIVSGSIDRWITIYEGGQPIAAEVIDYKTDRGDPGNDRFWAERTEFYRPQIQAYRRAVSQLTGLSLDRVFGTLVMLGIDRLVDVG